MEGEARLGASTRVGLVGNVALAAGLVVVDDGGAFTASVWDPVGGGAVATLALGATVGLVLTGMRTTRPPREPHPGLDPRLAWLAVVVGALAAAAVHVLPRWYDSIAREDWIVEWISAGAAVAAAAWAWSAGRQQAWAQRAPLWVLAAGFVVMAGEELSWLQRILGYGTPASLEANSQGESNLHNLATDEVQSAFYLGISLVLVVLPFVARWSPGRLGRLHQLAPGRVPLAIAVVSVASTYGRTGLVAHHVTFWIAATVLLLWDDGPPDRLGAALLALLVVGQVALAEGGADLPRAWAPSEYREALSALALAAWARELLLRARHTHLDATARSVGGPHGHHRVVRPRLTWRLASLGGAAVPPCRVRHGRDTGGNHVRHLHRVHDRGPDPRRGP